MTAAFYIETPHTDRHDIDKAADMHPERAARLTWVRHALNEAGVFQGDLVELEVQKFSEHDDRHRERALDELSIVHDPRYLRKLARASLHAAKRRQQYIDADTYITRETIDVIADSVSAVRNAARQAYTHKTSVFCAVRPPGHHASKQAWGGFCVANFSAYAARQLQSLGAEKVAIIDWDAHHGNGTQSIFNADSSVYYLSLHANNIYPSSGKTRDKGAGIGKGFTHNVPLAPGVFDTEYMEKFLEAIETMKARFEPDALVISAGFDGHTMDPLGSLNLSSGIYGEMTDVVCAQWPGRPIVSVLEGGYDRQALGESVVSHIKSLTK